MRSQKKVLATVVAVFLLITMLSVYASAATTTLDFEDGKVPSGVYMALKDDGTADGDPSILSVVEFNGSKMLKIDSQANGTPKVKFDAAKLLGDNYAKAVSIEYDIIIEKPGDTQAGWNGGTVGATPTGPSGWANGKEYTIENYEKNVTDVQHLKNTLAAGYEFKDPAKAFFMFMNWANNGTDIYIDNVVFKDADGNPIEIVSGTASSGKASNPKPSDPGLLVLGLTAAGSLIGLVSMKRKNK